MSRRATRSALAERMGGLSGSEWTMICSSVILQHLKLGCEGPGTIREPDPERQAPDRILVFIFPIPAPSSPAATQVRPDAVVELTRRGLGRTRRGRGDVGLQDGAREDEAEVVATMLGVAVAAHAAAHVERREVAAHRRRRDDHRVLEAEL